MPTARGWAVSAMGLASMAAAAVFGTPALGGLGLGLVVLVAAAVGVVRLGKHEVVAGHDVAPGRSHPEQPVTVTISLVNRGTGTAPLLLLDDALPVELAGRARFAVHGIEPAGRREVSYTVRPPRRGVYRIGPLHVSYVDPFGLAAVAGQAASATRLLVRPRIERLTMPRHSSELRSLSVSALRQLTGGRGEDFYTLREYVEGDDLRKIHWRSTARLDRTMIRQEETPWHTRATVLLNDLPSPGDRSGAAGAFERAVEAAASAVDLYHRSGYGYRLVCSRHPGLPAARGAAHYHRCLDLLATIEPASDAPVDSFHRRLAELERRPSPEGSLVAVSPAWGRADAVMLTRCRRRFRDVVAVVLPPHRFGTESTRVRWEGERHTVETLSLLGRGGVRVVVVGAGEPLSAGWAAVTGGGGGSWARKAGRA